MKKLRYIVAATLSSAMFLSSCDLNEFPKMETTGNEVYSSTEGYEQALAKIYAAYVIRGNEFNGGNADLKGEDQYFCSRSCFNLQECGTDEIVFTWAISDELLEISQLKGLNGQSKWIAGAYYSLYYIVTLANDFIRNCSDDGEIGQMKNEARFMRAYAYSQIMDFWPVGAFVTEKDPIGAYEPKIATRKEICEYVVSELEDLVNNLPEKNVQYRANKYAAAALLSRVCINAPVYTETTGSEYYDKCIKYSEMVINGGYSLENDFFKLFNAENYKRTNEIIFSFYSGQDGSNGNGACGSTTMIICGECNEAHDDVKAFCTNSLGSDWFWQLFRARKEAAQRFESNDNRNLFFSKGRSISNPSPIEEKDAGEGYVFCKFCNTNDDGSIPAAGLITKDITFSQVDLPVLRLSEVILNEAEAILRGGSGATKSAVDLVNQVRKRAGVGNFTQAELEATTNGVQYWNLLEERGREFMLESLRRTDLIRFNAYAGDTQYNWEWKGGVLSGTQADAKYKFFPLPVAELSANSALYDPYYK